MGLVENEKGELELDKADKQLVKDFAIAKLTNKYRDELFALVRKEEEKLLQFYKAFIFKKAKV